MQEKVFDISRVTRENFSRLVNSLSEEQLNRIPAGFANNIAWNFGHIIAGQQTIFYMKAGLAPRMPEAFMSRYRKGTRPVETITAEEIKQLHAYLPLDCFREELASGKFESYESFTTEYGAHIDNIYDAIPYVAVHDALHYGYALAIKKAL